MADNTLNAPSAGKKKHADKTPAPQNPPVLVKKKPRAKPIKHEPQAEPDASEVNVKQRTEVSRAPIRRSLRLQAQRGPTQQATAPKKSPAGKKQSPKKSGRQASAGKKDLTKKSELKVNLKARKSPAPKKAVKSQPSPKRGQRKATSTVTRRSPTLPRQEQNVRSKPLKKRTVSESSIGSEDTVGKAGGTKRKKADGRASLKGTRKVAGPVASSTKASGSKAGQKRTGASAPIEPKPSVKKLRLGGASSSVFVAKRAEKGTEWKVTLRRSQSAVGSNATVTTGNLANKSSASGQEQERKAMSIDMAGNSTGSNKNPPQSNGSNPPVLSLDGGGAGSAAAGMAGDWLMDDEDMAHLQTLLESRGFSSQRLAALGSRMYSLVQRSFGSSASVKAQQLLEGLQAKQDEGQQMQAVMEICEMLLMGNEDTLVGFPTKQMIPALVSLLRMEHNFDMMHHASRALTYMLDSLPRSSSFMVDAIPVFIEKLQSINCMDVAEQSLKALEILSRRHCKAIVDAGGIRACLEFLDFFSTDARRSALAITANCCACIGVADYASVKPWVPVLTSCLENQDKKSLESVCVCFSRLVDNCRSSSEILTDIGNAAFLVNIQRILIITPPMIVTSTFITVVRMLSSLCCYCPKLAVDLLNCNVAETLCFLLTGSNEAGTGDDVELVTRTPQELMEITTLISELMPPLPTDGIFSVNKLIRDVGQRSVLTQRFAERLVMSSFGCLEGRAPAMPVATQSKPDPPAAAPNDVEHANTLLMLSSSNPVAGMLQEDNAVIVSFIRSLFAMLHKVYTSSAGPNVRYKCLQALLRMIYYAKANLLMEILSYQQISGQIAAMLGSLDLRVIVGALQLTDVLLEKLPDTFHVYFRRQGVMHQIIKLADKNAALVATAQDETEIIRPESPESTMSYVSSSSSSASSSPRIKLETRYDDDSLDPIPDFPPPPPLNFSALDAPPPFLDNRFTFRLGRQATAASSADSFGFYGAPQDPRLPLTGVAPLSQPPAGTSTGFFNPTSSAFGQPNPPSTVDPIGESVSQSLLAAAAASLMSAACPEQITRGLASPTQARHATHASSTSGKSKEKPSSSSPKDDASSSANGQMRLSDLLKRKKHPKRAAAAANIAGGGKKASLEEETNQAAVPPAVPATKWSDSRIDELRTFAAFEPPSTGASPSSSVITIKTEQSNVACGGSATVGGVMTPSDRERIEAWIHEQAARLKKVYFGSDAHPALDLLNRLTRAIQTLQNDREQNVRALRDIADILCSSDISAFEVIHSGLVSIFLKYLSSDDDSPKFPSLDERLGYFLRVFLNCPADVKEFLTATSVAPPFPLSNLVAKLHACINQLEQFPVRVHELASGTSTVRSGINPIMQFFNTHQIKCQLQRHPQCSGARDWQGGLVKVDPFALVHTVERYLISRGYGEKVAARAEPNKSSETTARSNSRLQILIGDQVLPHNMTMYQAIRQYASNCGNKSGGSQLGGSGLLSCNVWAQTHVIQYRLHVGSGESNVAASSVRPFGKKSTSKSEKRSDVWWNQGGPLEAESPITPYLRHRLPDEVTIQDASLEVICLLRILHRLNANWGYRHRVGAYTPAVPSQEFVNAKLTAKANRQLFDPLVILTNSLPPWLTQLPKACPFLFPFETRQMLLHTLAFDRDRALQHLLDTVPDLGASSNPNERITPRLERKKKVISRKNILQQAEAVFHDLGNARSMLEIQYENEAGTGLGPTLEFYALVSKELQSVNGDMWRVDSTTEDGTYVHAPNGLYAQPIGRHVKTNPLKATRSKFKFLGKFMAKAVMDSRMIDIPLSVTFYKWLVGEEKSLQLSDLFVVDPAFATSFITVKKVAWKRDDLDEASEEAKSALTVDGTKIDELGFDFTLPGYATIELKKHGKNVGVNAGNVREYAGLVQYWTLYQGVQRQMEAFREGFESVFPLSHLRLFYPDEMDLLFCGIAHEPWDVKYLIEVTKTDHGYTHDSRAIKFLFSILSSYSAEQQRKFVHFLTGSPRLPVGGFRSLSPRFTIVCKAFDEFDNPDQYLPSVMTCVNYLKLPDYSSIEVMQLKLQQAVEDGCQTFHLS